MTEQELRDKLISIAPSAVYANESEIQAIVDLAKAYADARESKSANKVAEIRRLCKAFLYDLPCSHNVAVIGDFLDAYADNKILDEFKKTIVAAKDAEIARLWTDFYKIKFELETAGAEIKRLRDILDDSNLSDHDARWSAFGIADALSPAPVTEGPMVQDNYCPLCIGTGKEIGVYKIGICSCRTPISPLNEDQE